MARTPDPSRTIAFQGVPGAYSDLACRHHFPRYATLPSAAFEDAFDAVRKGRARYAMIPIENSVAGRVADIHRLMPDSGLYIVAEHFQRVNHYLLAPKGASLKTIRTVHSHIQALSQCRRTVRRLRLQPVVHADTAGAAAEIAARGDSREAAIASSLAGEIYGLKSLKAGIEDAEHNTTRFIMLSASRDDAPAGNGPVMTSFIFRVRNVPAALYKALGGFATNGINMTKLESYMVEGNFWAAMFYADIEGHPEDRLVRLALDECKYFSSEFRLLGTYPMSPFRRDQKPHES